MTDYRQPLRKAKSLIETIMSNSDDSGELEENCSIVEAGLSSLHNELKKIASADSKLVRDVEAIATQVLERRGEIKVLVKKASTKSLDDEVTAWTSMWRRLRKTMKDARVFLNTLPGRSVGMGARSIITLRLDAEGEGKGAADAG